MSTHLMKVRASRTHGRQHGSARKVDVSLDKAVAESVVVEHGQSSTIIPSSKSYVTAVCLSAVFGVLGVHHFYLGRYLEGVLDFSLAVLAYGLYLTGHPALALLVFMVDSLHTFIVTIMLLTGSIKDGDGHLVCYPGQRLGQGKKYNEGSK